MGIQAWRCAVVLTLVGACIAVTLYHHHQQPSFALLQDVMSDEANITQPFPRPEVAWLKMLSKSTFPPWPAEQPNRTIIDLQVFPTKQAKANDEQLQKDVTAAIKKAVDAAQKGYDDELKKATTTAASSARSSYDDMIKESFASYIKTGKDRGQ